VNPDTDTDQNLKKKIQLKSCYYLFDPSIRQHSGIRGAADKAVLNIVRKKTIPQKIFIKNLFWIKNCNLLIPSPSYRMPKLQEKPSALKRENPAL
jgi:hypothetical protein